MTRASLMALVSPNLNCHKCLINYKNSQIDDKILADYNHLADEKSFIKYKVLVDDKSKSFTDEK
ncbi:hypothetical protein DPMN_080141 [Dreissena polymorpha]|uniref:Uncharacterized protein n=1 Tax=Dreissena polymorpha TaxID=45954 RepID=A0A9D4BTK6_DREPO|nr:hypothetical protein DPMN_080141 [Dreissena polymorpha]